MGRMTGTPSPPEMARLLLAALADHKIPANAKALGGRRPVAVVLVGNDPDLNVWCMPTLMGAPRQFQWRSPHATAITAWQTCHGSRAADAARRIAIILRSPGLPLAGTPGMHTWDHPAATDGAAPRIDPGSAMWSPGMIGSPAHDR